MFLVRLNGVWSWEMTKEVKQNESSCGRGISQGDMPNVGVFVCMLPSITMYPLLLLFFWHPSFFVLCINGSVVVDRIENVHPSNPMLPFFVQCFDRAALRSPIYLSFGVAAALALGFLATATSVLSAFLFY